MEAAAGFSATIWRERDILTGASWEESSAATGYLYQILVRLIDKSGNKVTLDDKEIKVQIQGDGQLAGMDSGDLADVTPFSSDSRKTYKGDMTMYVRRTGREDIRVFLKLCVDGKEVESTCVLPGGR